MSIKKTSIQNEALKEISKHHKCGVAISMGVGKTRIAIQHFKKNYDPLIKVLVVIPKNSIASSWLDELKKMNLESYSSHFTFSTYLSINKHNPDDYDIVYLDECHNLLFNHKPFLSEFKGKILGLTGTPPVRVNSEKYLMVNEYCPIVYSFSVDQATDEKILNDYKIYVHMLSLNKMKTLQKKTKTGKKWYSSEYDDYIYLSNLVVNANTPKQKQFASILRMKALMDYPTKESYTRGLLTKMKHKTIVFANTQKQADTLCKHSYHSNNAKSDENLQLFKDGRVRQLSCVMQLNEGVTVPDLKEGIILHAYGNERKTAQRIGRLLRLNPTETAVCHILCYKGTVDEKWVGESLKSFESSKITYIEN